MHAPVLKRRFLVVALFAIVLLLAILAGPLAIYVDYAFICENTGSRRGHREWVLGTAGLPLGLKTRRWYWESPLETFIRNKYPQDLDHRWTSYAGTGRDIYGLVVMRAHGRPGPILSFTRIIPMWVTNSTDVEKKRLYDTFRTADKNAIRTATTEIENRLFDQ
jgi:hypothetical protein